MTEKIVPISIVIGASENSIGRWNPVFSHITAKEEEFPLVSPSFVTASRGRPIADDRKALESARRRRERVDFVAEFARLRFATEDVKQSIANDAGRKY